MLEQRTRREAGAAGVPAYQNQHRRKMLLALALLLASLIVVLVKNNQMTGADDSANSEDTTTAWVPRTFSTPTASASASTSPETPAAIAKKHVAVPKPAAPATEPAVVATNRAVLPPLAIEVVAGNKQNGFRSSSNSLKVEMPANSVSTSADLAASQWGPATNAVEQVRSYATKAPAVLQPTNVSYPLLAQQMKVQGAVLLQAIISADGVIRDVNVLSGPAILASAAREAALQWKFKPYVVNGKPVETTAKITVNFTIKVLDNVIKDVPAPVVAMSRAGNS